MHAQMVIGVIHRLVCKGLASQANIRLKERWSAGNVPKDTPALMDGTDGYSISMDVMILSRTRL